MTHDRTGDWVTGGAAQGDPPSAGRRNGRTVRDSDAFWRRPPPGSPDLIPPPAPAARAAPPYEGPPRAIPAPPNWTPPVLVPVTPPRTLPAQDESLIDAQEKAARTISQGIGLVAAAVIVILIFALCARVL